jgi:transcriptional regulator with PAS, ATPase and Fis domain
MKKKVILITGTEGTRAALHEQLISYLGESVLIESYAIDSGIEKKLKADLIVISTSIIYEDALKCIEDRCPVIVARRTINYGEIEKVLFIPAGEKVLFVNDCRQTAIESIEWLNKLGIDAFDYVPLYPGIEAPKEIRYAVTPGETHLVPSYVKNVIDIGPRLIDITTITEILKAFNIFEEKRNEISTIYLNKIINMGKRLAQESKEKSQAYNHVVKVIDNVNEGLLAFDKDGIITVLNENLKYMLGIKKTGVIGKKLYTIFQDSMLYEYICYGEYESIKVFNVNDSEIIVNKFRIKEDKTTVMIFKYKNSEQEEKEAKKELYRKGYYAKYHFEDIIGSSNSISSTKQIAKKLSKLDLTVLIEGESGTGKELFASAIHNASNRKNKPFIAVNFSSLSENLVESELFGYEEGAFTGAVKGGKAGLFEQALGGTIFLDEIGDISLKVQARLLRVLQEKEIMRVGGSKIIPVDVRIIAATNADLNALVEQGKFRSDLYHRLKVLYLKIPPLRDRKEDIIEILQKFLRSSGKENMHISRKVIDKLYYYDWSGNVRELKNTFDYMSAVCEGENIDICDLPEESFFKANNYGGNYEKYIKARGDLIFILSELYGMALRGEKGSRQALLRSSKNTEIKLTEQMIRTRLDELENLGLIEKRKGKAGTTISSKGISFLNSSQS